MQTISDFLKAPEKKRLLENFFSLSVLKGANYLLPLITLPYLLRVLGPQKYGIVVFAQAFVQYFVIITDFGFELSATREISVYREDQRKVSEIFSAVMIIKATLMLFSLLILVSCVFFIPKFSRHWQVYLFAFGMVLGNLMFPVWLFQGMERMKYITLLNIIAKIIFTIFIFVIIRQASDFIWVPLINSMGFIIAGIIALWIVFKNFAIQFRFPSQRTLLFHLKDSAHFFISRFSLSMYTITNTFILGIVTNETWVGYYGAADKIIKAMESLLHPLAQALYPYMSKQRDILLYKKALRAVLSGSLLGFLVVLLLADPIIQLVAGAQYAETVHLLRLFSIELPIVYISTFLGLPLLAALGLKGYFNYSVISASVVHLILIGSLCVLYYGVGFPHRTVVISLIGITIFTEFLILMIRSYPVVKFKLLKTS